MTQDLKTKLIQEAQERFKNRFPYRRSSIGDWDIFDPDPDPMEILDNLATEIGNAVDTVTKKLDKCGSCDEHRPSYCDSCKHAWEN